MSRFTKATRKRSKLRMAIDGPSGSGKTMTALRFAFAIANRISISTQKPAKVAVIDSEHGSASKYQGDAPDGIPFDFDVLELSSFAPTEYTAAIAEAEKAGYAVLVIDSLSHAWTGEGGALELKDRQGGNSFTAWKNITPMHNRMIEAITGAQLHIIATMRSKTEYVLEKDTDGKTVPRKIGLAPVQRAGMEYEFDVYASIDHAHIMTVTKSRCSALQDVIAPKPGAGVAEVLVNWLETGEAGELPAGTVKREYAGDESVKVLNAIVAELEKNPARFADDLEKAYGVNRIDLLTENQAAEQIDKLGKELERKRKRTAKTVAPQPIVETTAPLATEVAAEPKPRSVFSAEATADSAAHKPVKGPSQSQRFRLAELRDLVLASRSITAETHPEEAKAAWAEALEPFGVSSAGQLPNSSIPKLIEHLEKKYDAFPPQTGAEQAEQAA